ncbi:MAG TPA: hypothetical protein VFB25_10870 [Gaiellaceae bacterium]|nr:hypothetical protein [Gaiellaceae bacterium]
MTRSSRATHAGTREGVTLRYFTSTGAHIEIFLLPDQARDVAEDLVSHAALAERAQARTASRSRGL